MWEFIFKNSGSNGDDRSPSVHLWFSPQTQVSISFHYNKLTYFSICQLLMTGLWCLANKEWARAALPTASLAMTTWPTLARRRTGRRFLLLLDTGCAQKPRWPHSGFSHEYQNHHFHDKCRSTGNFLGKTNSPNITVVDTPGFKVGFSFILCRKTFQFSILNVCRTSATQSLWRSWWMFLETRSKRLKTSMCTRNYVILMFQNRSKRSRALWLFTNTKTGSQVPSQGHSGWSPKCLVRLWNICSWVLARL